VGESRGVVPPHAHHAVQVAIAVNGLIRMAGANGDWQECRAAIVRPDATHSFDGNGVLGALLFVDPESVEGAWLRSFLLSDVTIVPAVRAEKCATELRTLHERPLEALPPDELIRYCVRALSAGVPPARRMDARIAGVLATIRSADDLRISLNEAAARVFLSPGRFAHLFTEHVGLPFRRYLLWRKLTRAILRVGRGRSLSEAAHAAGFADAAHFTRTCNQMFGISPSFMSQGEFFEIAPPFEWVEASA